MLAAAAWASQAAAWATWPMVTDSRAASSRSPARLSSGPTAAATRWTSAAGPGTNAVAAWCNCRRRPEPISPEALAGALEESTEAETDELIERWRVAELLSRIPREEATMLRLRFYEGLAQPEIAARMGMKLGTVKSRMVGALARLRDLIEEEEERR